MEELTILIAKLFNTDKKNINCNQYSQYSNCIFLLKKDNKRIVITVSKQNIFLKLESNNFIDLEKNPKKNYFINYEDLEFLSRSNRLNSLLNDL